MSDETTVGRSPRSIVELCQPRCRHTFGSSPCTATGTPCYQTFTTCKDRSNYDDTDASVCWRFVEQQRVPRDLGEDDFGDFSDPDNIKTNGIPSLESVSTTGSRINPGAHREGQSPFGSTAKMTIRMKDIPWDDHVGDPYLSSRSGFISGAPLPSLGGFWRLWQARNDYTAGMTVNRYDGYEGQSLSSMRKREMLLESVEGPDFSGNIRISAVDPLRYVNDDDAKYPPATDLELASDISNTQTTGIQLFGLASDLDMVLGDDVATKYLRIGDEVLSYTGYTDDGSNFYTLTGVTRAVFGAADDHDAEEALQRSALFTLWRPWDVLTELLTFDGLLPAAYIPYSDWVTECETYIPTAFYTRLITEPQGIRSLAGEVCQQAPFYVWWESYESEVKLLTLRPPSAPVATLTDEDNILDGINQTKRPEDRITQVVLYYDIRDPLGDRDPENYRRRYRLIDEDAEAAGERKSVLIIFADWITTRQQAVDVSVKLILRYKGTPRLVTVRIDAKDRTIQVGDLSDVFSQFILNADGSVKTERYQVLSAEELDPGHTYVLNLQTYQYVGRFAVYMAEGTFVPAPVGPGGSFVPTPNYGDATEEERNNGSWYADDDGLLSDGSEGYLYQ